MIRQSLFRASHITSSASTQLCQRASIASRLQGRPIVAVTRNFSISTRYRSEAEASKSEDAAAKSDPKSPEAEKHEATLKELEAKKKEAADMADKWKRSIADFRNLQEQTKREVTAAREFAIQKFARDLIETVDTFERALDTVPKEKLTEENNDLKTLHDGLRMTENIFLSTLKKHGLDRIDPSVNSEKFDPNKHEATFLVPQPDKEDGTVFHTQQKGFTLNGRVLRAPKVGVVKNS